MARKISTLTAGLSGYVDLGMKRQAMRLAGTILEKRNILPDRYPDLLEHILEHLAGAPDQIDRFLINVRHLEGVLKRDDREAWEKYSANKRGQTYNSSSCTVRAIRKARC